MIPIALDPGRLRFALAGSGPAASRRRVQLTAAGADVIAIDPNAPDLAGIDVLWIADLPDPETAALARLAKRAGVLVNVEDRPALCDFHSVAELRRGPLLIAISTGGESPGLARRVRDRIAALLGPEWTGRVSQLGDLRRRWRAEGLPVADLARLTDDHIDQAGWLA